MITLSHTETDTHTYNYIYKREQFKYIYGNTATGEAQD